MLAWLPRLRRVQPLVLAIDDGHWADPDTAELTRAVLAGTDRIPLLVVWAMRPEASSHGWAVRTCALADHAHRTTELRLGPLDAAAADQLLGLLLPGALDAQRRAEVIERGGGNPLYLEEVLRAVVEQGASGAAADVDRDDRHLDPASCAREPADRPHRPAVPGARRVAQVAAAVGRTFPVAVVARVLGDAIDDDEIAELYRAEIVHEVRRRPELVCAFTHRLLQEAAVSTLTAGRRAELYGRIAAAFEAAYGDAVASISRSSRTTTRRARCRRARSVSSSGRAIVPCGWTPPRTPPSCGRTGCGWPSASATRRARNDCGRGSPRAPRRLTIGRAPAARGRPYTRAALSTDVTHRFARRRQTAGRYVVEEPLGSGAMGAVYLARRDADGARVALKVMRPS